MVIYSALKNLALRARSEIIGYARVPASRFLGCRLLGEPFYLRFITVFAYQDVTRRRMQARGVKRSFLQPKHLSPNSLIRPYSGRPLPPWNARIYDRATQKPGPLRLCHNVPFSPISASDENFNPQNTLCIPPVEIFIFLDLKQN